jgi:hypothetical protein
LVIRRLITSPVELIFYHVASYIQEERFLYPIYPLLAYIAGNTLDHTLRILTHLFTPPALPTSPPKTPHRAVSAARVPKWVGPVKTAMLVGCVVLSLVLFTARVASNAVNYGGTLLTTNSNLLQLILMR